MLVSWFEVSCFFLMNLVSFASHTFLSRRFFLNCSNSEINTLASMGNFFIILFTVPLLRKYLQSQETLPKWDKYLVYIRNYMGILFVLNIMFKKDYEGLFEAIWDCLYLFILYILYENRENRIAKILFYAALPFVVVSIIDDFSYVFPKFYEEYEEYFDGGVTIGFIWMLSYGFGAANQHKAFLREQKKRQEEEFQNKIIAARKDELEVMVQERTTEILKQKEELEHALEELKETQNQLIQREKLASLGELTAGIAHEIQNPLNFVNNFSEVSVELIDELKEERSRPATERDVQLEDEILEDIIQNLQKISHHGKRASGIVKGMLEHSRASTGEKQPTDINALADEYLRLSYHGLRAKDKSFNADFKMEFAEGLPKVKVIPQDFGRVLLNLINNAFYAVQQKEKLKIEGYKPTVVVSTQKIDESIEIKVTDNGTGMPEGVKQKIFQPFFTTKPTGEGTGLGLSLSYDIVTKGHNGTLEVDSIEGESTTFKITIPV